MSSATAPAAAHRQATGAHQRVASGHYGAHAATAMHFGSPVSMTTPTAGVDEKAMIVAERFRTRMCRHVEAGGACPYTNHCMFAHTTDQLRTVDANMADNITSEDAVRDFQHRELVHARKARRVARRRAKLQLARAAKAKEAGTDPLNGGSDHDDTDHGEHDDDHTTTDHDDHEEPTVRAQVAAPEVSVPKRKGGASPTEPQPKAKPAEHHDAQRTATAKAVVSPTEVVHHRPRVSTTPRQSGVAHPPPAYSASSVATSPTNGNASFVVNTSQCCHCTCHCHPPQPLVSTNASPVRAAPSVTFYQPQPKPQPHAFTVPHAAPAPPAAQGSAAQQYGFASDYMAQLLQAQAQQHDDDDYDEEGEGEWAEEEQQPVQPAYYHAPQPHHAAAVAAPHVAVAQPQYSGYYAPQQPQQPVMDRSHSHHSLAAAGPTHSQQWSPEHGLGLGATAATMQQHQHQQQYGFQQPTQPVAPSPTAASGVHTAHAGARIAAPQQPGVKPYAPSPPASVCAPTPKATTAGTPTAGGADTASVRSSHAAGAGAHGNPNYYPMAQVQSQQQLNHQLHDMLRYQQQQYQHHVPPAHHVRSLSHPLSPDTPTARSVASHPPHSHAPAQPQAVYDAARHIVLVETPVNGPDGSVRGSRTSWRHEPYDLLMPQHH
jgi:hypothetical protein